MNYATAIDEILDLAKEKPLEAREQALSCFTIRPAIMLVP
jgi:hypothetical protein